MYIYIYKLKKKTIEVIEKDINVKSRQMDKKYENVCSIWI